MADVEQELAGGEPSEAISEDLAPSEDIESKATPFSFEMDWADGKTETYENADQLKEWMRGAARRESDYTRKSQERETEYQRKQTELDRKGADFDRRYKDIQAQEEKYNKYREAFQRRPEIARALEQAASNPASPNEVFERSQQYADTKTDEVTKRMDEIQQRLDAQDADKRRTELYGKMRDKYDDFDESMVTQALSSLGDGNLEPLLEMIYKAEKYNPEAKPEGEILNKLQKKQESRLAPAGGKVASNNNDHSGETLEEAKMRALKDYGVLDE